jgi:outer membrane receptor protein involved in Fe transport
MMEHAIKVWNARLAKKPLAVLIGALLHTGYGYAQQASPSEAQPDPAGQASAETPAAGNAQTAPLPVAPSGDIEKIIVTGNSGKKTKMAASVSTSDIGSDSPILATSRSVAEIIKFIPGLHSESSGGDGNANISIRGLPITSGGAKYLQLWEDGLPVFEAGDFAFATADIYMRADSNIDHVQSIRGGSSAILASNSPGGVINFISKTGKEGGGSMAVSKGLTYDNTRVDAEAGHNFGNGWYGHIGGFYRVGEGVRKAGYDVEKGGQIKGNLTREFDGGFVRVNFKYLDDHVIGYMPTPMFVSGTNSNPSFSAIPGYNPFRDSLQSRHTDTISTTDANGNIVQRHLSDGQHAKVAQVGLETEFAVGGGWTLGNRFKVASTTGAFRVPFPASAGTQANVGGWGVDNFNSYFGTSGALTYRYATGPRAGNALDAGTSLAVAHTFNEDINNADYLVNNMDLSRKFEIANGTLDVHGGWYHSEQSMAQYQSWPTYLTSVEGKDTAYVDVYSNGAKISNGGLLSYAALEWGNCCSGRYYDIRTKTEAFYLDTSYKIGQFTYDLGVRRDNARTTGQRNFGQSFIARDLNGNGTLEPTETRVPVNDPSQAIPVNFEAGSTSYTAAVNYIINSDMAVFARDSKGARANSERLIETRIFSTSANGQRVGDANDADIVNEVRMSEAGFKYKKGPLAAYVTLFRARSSELLSEDRGTGILSSAEYEAKGVEFEGSYRRGGFSVSGNATYTRARILKYDLNPVYVGKIPQRQADWVYSIMPTYSGENYMIGASIVGTTKSYFRNENILVMPSYHTVNAFAEYRLTERMSVSVDFNNLFNKMGITEGEDSSVNGGTGSFNNVYVRARSIPGRSGQVKLKYTF